MANSKICEFQQLSLGLFFAPGHIDPYQLSKELADLWHVFAQFYAIIVCSIELSVLWISILTSLHIHWILLIVKFCTWRRHRIRGIRRLGRIRCMLHGKKK